MGGIDLDPASCGFANLTVRASRFYTVEMDGLGRIWKGRIFLNPPFGVRWRGWILKLCDEIEAGRVRQAVVVGQGNVLWAMTTEWFRPLLQGSLLIPDTYPRYYDPATRRWHSTRYGSFVAYLGPFSHQFAIQFGSHGTILSANKGN